MAGSEENKFIQGLVALIRDRVIEMTNGTQDQLSSIYFGRLPEVITDYTNVVVVPKGPIFDPTTLGLGTDIKSRDRVYEVNLYIFHDGLDEEQVLSNLSDLTSDVCTTIIANKRTIGGAEFVNVGKVEYDWAAAETQDKNTIFSSYALIPVIAIYRRI